MGDAIKIQLSTSIKGLEQGAFQDFNLSFLPLYDSRFIGLDRHGGTCDGKTRAGTPDLIRTNTDGSTLCVQCSVERNYWSKPRNIDKWKPINDIHTCINQIPKIKEIVLCASQEIPTNLANVKSDIIKYVKNFTDATITILSISNYEEAIRNDITRYKKIIKRFCPELYEYLPTERGERVTQDKVIDYLKKNGITSKSPLGIDEIIRDFKNASSDLLNIKSSIGGKHHIQRDETRRLIEWIETSSDEKKAACLIGTMGIGKTVITHVLCKELLSKKIPVLGIKTDHYTHIKNRQDLYKEIGLKDEILNLVATVSESKGKCVVILDQMDALSDSLSKDRTPLNIFASLVSNLVIIPKVKVVISCRKFDLDHDPTLSEIEFGLKVEVVPLLIDQVKEVINNLGIPLNVFTDKQIKLFQTPLHLQLLSEVYGPTMPIESIQTIQDLFDKLWDKFISKGNNNKFEAIYKLVDRMDSNKELTSPLSIFDNHLSNARTELQSNGILIIKRNQIGFFHQSFFDYCYARRFASENKSLTEKILKEHQGLFIRSQIKQILSYLRGAGPTRYINELKDLLESNKVRYHIKDLIMSLLGNQPDPIEVETDYVRQLFQKDRRLRDHFLKVVDSSEWFDILNEDYIKPLIMDDEKVLFLVMNYYQKILNNRTKEIFALMSEVQDFPEKDRWCYSFLWNLENWSDEAIEFFIQTRKRFDLNNILRAHP